MDLERETPYSGDVFEKLPVGKLVKIFHVFYRIREYLAILVFILNKKPFQVQILRAYFFKIQFYIILPSMLRFSKGVLPTTFSATETLHVIHNLLFPGTQSFSDIDTYSLESIVNNRGTGKR
jgi:hypothetical protein